MKDLVLGDDQNFIGHEIDPEQRSQHMHVIGATGSGKSRFLLSLIQQDIRNRKGVCLIDPHGELVSHLVDWLAKNETLASRRTVRVLDMTDPEHSFGFNPLKASGEDYISATVDQATNALASVMGGEDLTQTPLLRLTLNAVCTALSFAGLTLNEAPYLLNPNYPEERFAITSAVKNPTYKMVWDNYNELAARQPKIYIEQFQPAERRFIPFIANAQVRSILGQNENILNLKQAMDGGEIILVDLSRTGGRVPAESTQIVGRLLINNLVAKAYERDPRNARPFNLYVDEVQNYLSGDVPEILSQCRKFGLHLTIAHQYLEQLRQAGDLTYHGVMGTARNKVVFTLDNPEDAEIMAQRVFVGFANFEMAKKSLIKPTVIGHEIIRLQSQATGASEAGSQTQTKTATESTAEAFGSGTARSRGQATGSTEASGLSTSVLDGQSLDLERHSTVASMSNAEMSGESTSASQSTARGRSLAQGISEGTSTGTTETSGYSEALRPIFTELPTAVYSLEEQKHMFMDKILSLPNRSAFVVLAGAGMHQITSLDVPDITVSKTKRLRIAKALKSESEIHKHPKMVGEEIKARFEAFLAKQALESEEDTIEFDPMNPTG